MQTFAPLFSSFSKVFKIVHTYTKNFFQRTLQIYICRLHYTKSNFLEAWFTIFQLQHDMSHTYKKMLKGKFYYAYQAKNFNT